MDSRLECSTTHPRDVSLPLSVVLTPCGVGRATWLPPVWCPQPPTPTVVFRTHWFPVSQVWLWPPPAPARLGSRREARGLVLTAAPGVVYLAGRWAATSRHYLAQGPGREGRGCIAQGVVEGVKVQGVMTCKGKEPEPQWAPRGRTPAHLARQRWEESPRDLLPLKATGKPAFTVVLQDTGCWSKR